MASTSAGCSPGATRSAPTPSWLERPSEPVLRAGDVRDAREYIRGYWPKLQRYQPEDVDSLIGLPRPYLVPASEAGHDFDFNELYYWDSYFMAQGLLDAGHKELVEGILEDLLYLVGRYGMVPNASRNYLTGRSQPPLLTSFILDVYHEKYQITFSYHYRNLVSGSICSG